MEGHAITRRPPLHHSQATVHHPTMHDGKARLRLVGRTTDTAA